MKLQRFFVEEKLEEGKEQVLTNKGLAHQLKSVFRKGEGDEFILLDNTGYEFRAHLMLVKGETVRVRIVAGVKFPYEPEREVYLFSSMIKKDKYELVLEKCTELGVVHFVPIISERSEKKGFNLQRGEKIVREAAEQSEKGKLPRLDEVMDLGKALEAYKHVPSIALHLQGGEFKTMSRSISSREIGIFVGPEGGWAASDLDLFEKYNVLSSSLGPQVLRAETAAMAAASLLLL